MTLTTLYDICRQASDNVPDGLQTIRPERNRVLQLKKGHRRGKRAVSAPLCRWAVRFPSRHWTTAKMEKSRECLLPSGGKKTHSGNCCENRENITLSQSLPALMSFLQVQAPICRSRYPVTLYRWSSGQQVPLPGFRGRRSLRYRGPSFCVTV